VQGSGRLSGQTFCRPKLALQHRWVKMRGSLAHLVVLRWVTRTFRRRGDTHVGIVRHRGRRSGARVGGQLLHAKPKIGFSFFLTACWKISAHPHIFPFGRPEEGGGLCTLYSSPRSRHLPFPFACAACALVSLPAHWTSSLPPPAPVVCAPIHTRTHMAPTTTCTTAVPTPPPRHPCLLAAHGGPRGRQGSHMDHMNAAHSR